MTTTEKKLDTLEIGVYTIRNDMLRSYEDCFSCNVQQLGKYLSMIVNDVQSKFWGTESNYSLYRIGTFRTDIGKLEILEPELVNKLDMFIDNQKRTIQIICQTLNYLPTGYFKMPDEMKKQIQDKIDEATTKYINDYVIKDLDTNGIKENDQIKS